MSTQTSPELDDLDLLDDQHQHARCVLCTGTRGNLIGVPFVAICGRRAINLRTTPEDTIPLDACPDCLRLFDQPCGTCGTR